MMMIITGLSAGMLATTTECDLLARADEFKRRSIVMPAKATILRTQDDYAWLIFAENSE